MQAIGLVVVVVVAALCGTHHGSPLHLLARVFCGLREWLAKRVAEWGNDDLYHRECVTWLAAEFVGTLTRTAAGQRRQLTDGTAGATEELSRS